MENPSAFPHTTGLYEPQCGMTLRDYFAAQALMGMLAGRTSIPQYEYATTAYELANDMMEARAALEDKE